MVLTKSGERRGRVYLGCSGWAYPTWKPGFYPAKTPSKNLLSYYASQLNSVEVNYTFRQLPKPSILANWLQMVGGQDFLFSFKAPQTVTHHKRLVNCQEAMERFFETIEPARVEGRLGLILFQLPPNFKADVPRLRAFLSDAKVHRLQFAFEFRHASWFTEETFAELRDAHAALCVAESDELQTPDIGTADYSCYRLRKTDYSAEELQKMVDRLLLKAQDGDVYAYFKHEDAPTGPIRAREVLSRVKGL